MEKAEKKTGYPSIDKPWLKYYDKFFDERDLPKNTIYQVAFERNQNRLSNIAIDCRRSQDSFNSSTIITYGEFFDNVHQCAKSLKELGTKSGEIIPLILPNIPEARYLIYANSMLGATTYPISWFLSANQLRSILSNCNPKTIVLFEPFYSKYEEVLNNSSIQNILLISADNTFTHANQFLPKMLVWSDFLKLGTSCEDIHPVKYSESHIAVIIGTSGTTGTSKSVCLSDDNINSAAFALLECFSGSFLDILIPSIGYGLVMMHYQIVAGTKVFLISELITDRISELICKVQPDMFAGGPVHYINLVQSKAFQSGTLPKIRNALCGGASLPKEIEEKMNGVTVGYEEEGIDENIFIRQGFALTESVATGTYSKRGAYKFGSVGIPFPYVTVSIFEPNTDHELPYGEHGEICITSPMIMLCYLNNPDETNSIIHIHKDGKRWIHTKDIGYMDDNGHLFHVDRIKNIFMRTGFNVHPWSIAEFINTLPFVKNNFVVGFEHPLEQHVPIAFVQLVDNCTCEIAEAEKLLREACYKNLEETSVPYGYVFVDELPVNLGGKIDRLALEEASEIDLMKEDVIPKKELSFIGKQEM